MNPVGWLLFFLLWHAWRTGWQLESEMTALKFPAPWWGWIKEGRVQFGNLTGPSLTWRLSLIRLFFFHFNRGISFPLVILKIYGF